MEPETSRPLGCNTALAAVLVLFFMMVGGNCLFTDWWGVLFSIVAIFVIIAVPTYPKDDLPARYGCLVVVLVAALMYYLFHT